jgi:hypothetical protein
VTPVPPPRLTAEQFEAARLTAIARFREERMQEPLEAYLEHFEAVRGAVEDLLEATVDLSQIGGEAVRVLTDPALLEAVRYLAGPPISEDDLKVLAEASLAPTRLRADPAMARRVIDTVLLGLDRNRFPWVAEDREPLEHEREAAAMASAALIASRRLMTSRANEQKEAQEDLVKQWLAEQAEFEEVPSRTIRTLDDAPKVGQFCGESMFGGRKADIVIRLYDGRVMPTECKVSNSSTNSVKRLNNDAAVKAGQWLDEFGTAQTVPAAVLSGVFKRHNLEQAQARGLTIFWAHDLDALMAFIESTKGA